MVKSTRSEAARRESWVLRELSLLRPRHEVVAHLTEYEGVSERTARRYVQRAQQKLLEGISSTQRDELLSQMISTLQSTTRRAAAGERYGEVVGAVRLLSQLTGLLERG
jgi:hypothetical protein